MELNALVWDVLAQSWLGVYTNVEIRTVHYGTDSSSVGYREQGNMELGAA